jgi:hypothetical protein
MRGGGERDAATAGDPSPDELDPVGEPRPRVRASGMPQSDSAKLAPAIEIAGEASAQRAGAFQVNRRLPSRREWAVAHDDHLRVPADTDFVADRPRDVLHQRLEILAFDAGLEVCKPVRRVGGRIGHAVMVEGVAVAPDSEFAHASLPTRARPR